MKSNTPIPKKAKRVFRGKIFEIWQWRQKMFDGSLGLFERIRRPDTATVILVVGDKIMIQQQSQPARKKFISLPGGRCDSVKEKPLVAAKREVLEETGYASGDIILWKKYNPSSSVVWTDYNYIFRNSKFIQKPKLDAGEKIKNKLVGFDELLALAKNDRFRHQETRIDFFQMLTDHKEKAKFKKLLFNK